MLAWGSGPGPSAASERACATRGHAKSALSAPAGHYSGHDDSAATLIAPSARRTRAVAEVEHAAPSPVSGGGIFRPVDVDCPWLEP
jgi:hypothetical protein